MGIASGSGPYIEGVRRGQFGVEIGNVMTVEALGLSLEPDGLHLNTQSQVKLGGLLGDAYRRFPSHPMASPLRSAASGCAPTPADLSVIFVTILRIVTLVVLCWVHVMLY